MGQFGIGQGVRRLEDQRFLTGEGRYTDDITLPRQCYAAFVRSPFAHAVITGIESEEAAGQPGVLGIYTAQDLQAAGVGDIPCLALMKGRDGRQVDTPPTPPWRETGSIMWAMPSSWWSRRPPSRHGTPQTWWRWTTIPWMP
ncbi:hypothetical protein [Fodinicurvata halophila]|uniref:hypothetical protein n=1 Tax=Fodinicurvata halophila TaxID=1419723 RepID=UPI003638781E